MESKDGWKDKEIDDGSLVLRKAMDVIERFRSLRTETLSILGELLAKRDQVNQEINDIQTTLKEMEKWYERFRKEPS